MSFTEVLPHQIDTWCYIYPRSIIHISMCKPLVYKTIVFLTVKNLFCMCLERIWETWAQLRGSSFLILADDLTDVYMIVNFAMQLQRELYLSSFILSFFHYLMQTFCTYHEPGSALSILIILTKVLVIILSNHYPNDQCLCNF